ncbi:MAG: Zn-ribbon domain-containing OB-fold protein [Acidimicrobiia bacterium]
MAELLPDLEWPVASEFWQAAQRGELCFPRCDGCGRFQWYPLPRCPQCHRSSFSWTAVEPRGRVVTFTVLHRAFLPHLTDCLPHTVVVVDVPAAPGVRLISSPVGPDEAASIATGSRVEIVFQANESGFRFPRVRPTDRG